MTTAYADGKMLAETDGGIGRITFNQPEKRNAMSIAMWHGLAEILAAFEADPAIRVVVLTGAGDRAFVSGADISQFAQNRADSSAQKEYDKLTSAGRAKLAAFAKPVIARIHGYCLGGGLGIAMQADLRIASDASQFGIPAARLGIAYGWDMVRKLVGLIGPAHARTLLYTGLRIDGPEAARIGLVNRVVPAAGLDEAVAELAHAIADAAPLSVAAAKLAINQTQRPEAERDIAAVRAAVARCFDSADYKEGRTAFMEKRRPRFTGG